jgi:hypothetical protein
MSVSFLVSKTPWLTVGCLVYCKVSLAGDIPVLEHNLALVPALLAFARFNSHRAMEGNGQKEANLIRLHD